MKEVGNDYSEDNIVEIVDEEENSFRFEHLMTFEYEGEWYCALTEIKEAVEETDDEDETERTDADLSLVEEAPAAGNYDEGDLDADISLDELDDFDVEDVPDLEDISLDDDL